MTEKFNEKKVGIEVQCVSNRNIKMYCNDGNDNSNNIFKNLYKILTPTNYITQVINP